MDLTKESNRIAAISGLANAASKNRNLGDRYLADMREDNLAERIFWEAPWSHKRPVMRLLHSGTPRWSWMSVHFSGPLLSRTFVNFWWHPNGPLSNDSPNIDYSFKNIKASCEREVKNIFGPVTEGLPTITASHITVKANYGHRWRRRVYKNCVGFWISEGVGCS
jgi:hypothetical protein